ncbi:glycosyltransferase family 87 protein [Mucilaginibacter polytrichastri]|nr:glycosyltransferase family 87 protein [Mucilaginibacter polytrichastri]
MKADVNGDYHIYWETGRNFFGGQKLYTPGLLDGGFTYPPFAALFFSLFSWMPFHTSAFLYSYFVDYGLWVVSLILVKKIFDHLLPGQNIVMPFILASLLSIGFYWHNFIWMNANMPVLCLTLLGIWFYINKKFNYSYLFFWAGAFFKVTPIIFLFFAALKRPVKEWPKIILMALPFIILPMLLRGSISAGIADWQGYYEAFIAPFSKGQTDDNIISLGIPVILNKLNTGNAELGYEPVLHLSEYALKILILAIQVLIVGALTIKVVYDKYVNHNDDFSAADLCIIFLITLLLPGRVWGHHHVCTSFIYTYLFILLRDKKILFGISFLLCLLMNFMTKGSIGQTMTDFLRQYTYITWVMIFIGVVIVYYGYFAKRERLATV